MIAIVLVAVLACASAAPRWNHHRHHPRPSPFDDSFERYVDENMFDTKRFWDELNRDLHREMMQLETMLSGFSRHFPRTLSTEGIAGNEYKIQIPLTGFLESEIVVKARKGLLMIQAVHNVKGESQNNYLDVRTLPACVSEQGSWSYENGVLKIIFPLERNDDSDNREVTVAPVPDHSREELETPTRDINENADIDLDRGDLAKDKELHTNEIPKVEATTYAVDLKGDVDFVPVPY